MSNQESWTSGWTYEPSSNYYYDDLGFNCYRITVNVQQPNSPPNSPDDSDPYDGEQNVLVTTDLDWSCSDPDSDDLSYYVYFGTDPIPDDGEYQGYTGSSYCDLPTLNYDTEYEPSVDHARWRNTNNQHISSAIALFEKVADFSFTRIQAALDNKVRDYRNGSGDSSSQQLDPDEDIKQEAAESSETFEEYKKNLNLFQIGKVYTDKLGKTWFDIDDRTYEEMLEDEGLAAVEEVMEAKADLYRKYGWD